MLSDLKKLMLMFKLLKSIYIFNLQIDLFMNKFALGHVHKHQTPF